MKKELTNLELEQFAEGNKEIFNRIFHSYYQKIVFFSARITYNESEAEDIASVVFFRLHKRRPKFDTELQLKAYLLEAARNLCFDYLRKQKREKANLQHRTFSNEDTEYFLTVQADYLQILREEVAGLPDRVRQVFELHYFERLTDSEIAARLGISISSVHTNKFNAKKMLVTKFLSKDLYILAVIICLSDYLPK